MEPKPHPTFSDYLVYPDGRIFSTKTNRFMKTYLNNGYEHISLSINGKQTNQKVHRLVAETFIPNPNNLPHVNHKDKDRQNNCIDNLEWITQLDNNKHSHCIKIYQYDLQNNLINVFESMTEASQKTGVSISSISNVCNGKRRTAGGYKWQKHPLP